MVWKAFPLQKDNLVDDNWLYILPEKPVAYIRINCLLLEIGYRVPAQKATVFWSTSNS